jgi:hypothetical protein
LFFDTPSRSLYALVEYANWDVRKSIDQGTSWTTVDTITNGTAIDFATDDQGNIYISGRTDNTGVDGTWTVRKSSDQGRTWLTVDSLTNHPSFPKLHFIPGGKGGLFAVGTRKTGAGGSTQYSWLVRRSRDGGTNWSTVDNYTGSPNTGATAITRARSGIIYVAGFGSPYVVRSSQDGGDSWQTIHTNPTGMQVVGMAIDPWDNLYLAGLIPGSLGQLVWIVHQRAAQGVWTSHFPFGNASSTLVSQAYSIVIDRAGNVLVGGSRRVAAGAPFIPIVQQLPAPALKVTRSSDSLVVTWPTRASGAVLEVKDALTPGSPWLPVGTPPIIVGAQNVVTVDITGTSQFFRLQRE